MVPLPVVGAWRYFAKTGACVMSSASVSAAAIRKSLMWWCCDLPLKTRRSLWLNQRSLPKNVMPQRLAGPSRLRPLLPIQSC